MQAEDYREAYELERQARAARRAKKARVRREAEVRRSQEARRKAEAKKRAALKDVIRRSKVYATFTTQLLRSALHTKDSARIVLEFLGYANPRPAAGIAAEIPYSPECPGSVPAALLHSGTAFPE